jgi:hypothetical protein
MKTIKDILEEFDEEFEKWAFFPKDLDGWKKANFETRDYLKHFIKQAILQIIDELPTEQVIEDTRELEDSYINEGINIKARELQDHIKKLKGDLIK